MIAVVEEGIWAVDLLLMKVSWLSLRGYREAASCGFGVLVGSRDGRGSRSTLKLLVGVLCVCVYILSLHFSISPGYISNLAGRSAGSGLVLIDSGLVTDN